MTRRSTETISNRKGVLGVYPHRKKGTCKGRISEKKAKEDSKEQRKEQAMLSQIRRHRNEESKRERAEGCFQVGVEADRQS